MSKPPAPVRDQAVGQRFVAPNKVRRDAPGKIPDEDAAWRFAGPQAAGSSSTARLAAVDEEVAAPGLGLQSFYGVEEFGVRDLLSLGVNLANGNLVLRDTDLKINAPGVATRSDRFYNGLSSRSGAFGKGWSMAGGQDTGLEIASSRVVFRGPSGFRAVFTGSGSSWSAPSGLNATLTKNADGTWKLKENGSGTTMTFTAGGFLHRHTDRNGVGLSYTYNADNTAASVSDAAGRVATFTYAGGVLTKITDSAGRQISYGYTSGRLTSSTNPDGRATTYGYDASGRLSSVTTARGVKVGIGYDTSGRVTSLTRYTALNGGGTAQTTTLAYPSDSSTTQTNAAGRTWTYTRDSAGRVTKVTDPLGRSRAQSWTANSSIATTTDAMGTGGVGGNITTYSYDAANNPTQAALPTGAVSSAVYTTGGACGSSDTANPDLPKCITDDAGNKTSMTYDALGNLIARADTTSGATGGAKLEYTRQRPAGAASGPACGGKPGQVCTVKDPNGGLTSYEYNTDGNLIKILAPSPLGQRTLGYDSLGRLASATNGRGQTMSYTYDAQDRLLTLAVPATDGGPAYTQYSSWDLDGNLTHNSGSTTSYDAQNRQLWVRDQSGSNTGHGGFSLWYDTAGNPHPSNQTATFDAANQVRTIGKAGVSCANDSTAQAGCVKLAYDNNGAETSRTLPGGVVQTITRDPAGRPTRMSVKRGSSVLSDLGYSYTKPGTTGSSGDRVNVQTSTDYAGAGTVIPAGAVTTYEYDSLDRVTSVVEKAAGAASASWIYAYDKAGNRTQQIRAGATGVGNGTTSYGYNTAHQLTTINGSSSNLAYDADGNETQAAGWDWVNVPRRDHVATTAHGDATSMTTKPEDGSVNPLAFSYGSANPGQTHRLMSAHGNTYLHSPQGPAQTKGSDGATTDYLLAPSGKAAAFTRPSGTGYYLHDHLGSVIAITDESGQLITTYRYDPYGNIRLADGQDVDLAWNNRLLYTGALLDTRTGLYRLGVRWYDPNTGRFTTPDPTTQETNPYLYAAGNPCNNTDPTGGCSAAAYVGGGATVLAGSTAVVAGALTAPTPVGWLGIAGGYATIVAGATSFATC